jgi:hypothetical protein
MDLPVNKVHIDSRFKEASGTHSDFNIRLSQSVQFPEDCVAIVDNITIPNTFYTVNANNDCFYVAEKIASNAFVRKVTLAHGNLNGFTFAAALADALNVGSPTVMGSNPYSAAYTRGTGKVLVAGSPSYDFLIMSDDQIQTHDGTGGLTIEKDNPRSGNGILRNRSNGQTGSSPASYTFHNNHTSGFLDLMPVHNCFIHSNLANNSVMTPRGLGDCIACCPISSSFGFTTHHNNTSAADAVDVSRKSFETLSFQLRDAYGNIIETNGASWSCSLIFMKKNI